MDNEATSSKKPHKPMRQIERSRRAYDDAILVWQRDYSEFDWGPWYIIKVKEE